MKSPVIPMTTCLARGQEQEIISAMFPSDLERSECRIK